MENQLIENDSAKSIRHKNIEITLAVINCTLDKARSNLINQKLERLELKQHRNKMCQIFNKLAGWLAGWSVALGTKDESNITC